MKPPEHYKANPKEYAALPFNIVKALRRKWGESVDPRATTPRGYPYPLRSWPPDAAIDIQLLAEAVDADVGNPPRGILTMVGDSTALPVQAWTDVPFNYTVEAASGAAVVGYGLKVPAGRYLVMGGSHVGGAARGASFVGLFIGGTELARLGHLNIANHNEFAAAGAIYHTVTDPDNQVFTVKVYSDTAAAIARGT